MRDRRDRPGVTAAVGGLALLAAGCAHNDVLVFGTSTTIGLNVQSAGTAAGPSIVLGYEREEAVWMPLIANGRDSRVANCNPDPRGACRAPTEPYPLDQALYQSTIMSADGTTRRTDSYSVFASLGAKFNGDVDGDGAHAGGGLAQFFATGNAALNVSNNEALVTALKLGEGASQADAVEAAALSEERLAALQAEQEVRVSDIAYVVGCANAGTPAWTALVTSTTLDAATQAALSAVPAERRAAFLEGHDNWVAALTTAAEAASCAR